LHAEDYHLMHNIDAYVYRKVLQVYRCLELLDEDRTECSLNIRTLEAVCSVPATGDPE
jgi:hypothetical protein